MPRAELSKYHAVDNENSLLQSMPEMQETTEPIKDLTNVNEPVQAVPINSPTDFTIITAATPHDTRKHFISRVYSILWLQLVVTSAFVGGCSQIKQLQNFRLSDLGFALFYMSVIITLSMTCCLFCLRSSLTRCPGNCLYLSLFTILTSYMIGYAGISYNTTTLLLSGISTLGIVTGLSLYAIQTKYDYTNTGGYLISGLLGIILFGFMVSFVNVPVIHIVYSSLGSIVFSFYIVYDTQLIVGGEHRKIMFHTDDYVLAAISLYLDIINLFLYLLDLISGGSPNN